jgi:hypothetical protein
MDKDYIKDIINHRISKAKENQSKFQLIFFCYSAKIY